MTLMERNHRLMTKFIQKAGLVLALVPVMAMPNAQLATNTDQFALNTATKVEKSVDELREQKAKTIDTYFKERSMPLYGSGMTFVLVAEKYGLDYRLLPAIAVRESSGGKKACGYNPFGWGSCKLSNFKSFEEAIENLGKNLGGANPRTARYYAGKSTMEKLYYYNGTVVASYPGEVASIMERIESDID
jgi:hypothetical protein